VMTRRRLLAPPRNQTMKKTNSDHWIEGLD
jgi:hypothetical protein